MSDVDPYEQAIDTIHKIASYEATGNHVFDLWQLRTWAFETEMALVRDAMLSREDDAS